MKIYFLLPLIQQKTASPPMFSNLCGITHLNTGVAGQKIFIFQMCPASASPFESSFGKGPAASARERARGAERQAS